jgi:hypothetical protein
MGADSSIGFTHEIYAIPPAMDQWNDAFFHALRDGQTVANSASSGLANVRWWNGGLSMGFDSPFLLNGNVKVSPAGYGS